MGKRSDFVRKNRDLYRTPPEPVLLLSPFLRDVEGFAEPFVGDGALVRTLRSLGHTCGFACDVEPLGDALGYAVALNALDVVDEDLADCTHIISNPPWPAKHGRGEPTLGFIRHLSKLRPTWFLLSADFKHNVYAAEVLRYCSDIVSIGRVKWEEGSDNTGKDNAAWYCFDTNYEDTHCRFHPRHDRPATNARWLEDLL